MTRQAQLMMCGCAASGTDSNGLPVCVPHVGLLKLDDGRDAARVVDRHQPDLTGRMARCSYGAHADRDSSFDLPFFKYRPTYEMDEYYCGCFGWD